jgi:hypothetical protein
MKDIKIILSNIAYFIIGCLLIIPFLISVGFKKLRKWF